MDNLLPFQLYLVQLQVALKRKVARMLLQGCLDTNVTSEISDNQLPDPTDPVANEAVDDFDRLCFSLNTTAALGVGCAGIRYTLSAFCLFISSSFLCFLLIIFSFVLPLCSYFVRYKRICFFSSFLFIFSSYAYAFPI